MCADKKMNLFNNKILKKNLRPIKYLLNFFFFNYFWLVEKIFLKN